MLRGLFLALLLVAAAAHADTPPAAAARPAPGCQGAAEYHQLDFWIGDWDTIDADTPKGPSIARARVTPIAQGCAIHELYEQTDGLIGDSILSYDAVRKQWQQTWVTNFGGIMVLYGNLNTDGTLVLEGEYHTRSGQTLLQRINWQVQDKGVREWAEVSKDGGKTWAPAFDVLFLKRQGKK